MVDSYVGFWFHCSPNPNFIPPEAQKPEATKKKGFPEYPEGDLIARALRLAFVGGEGEGDN